MKRSRVLITSFVTILILSVAGCSSEPEDEGRIKSSGFVEGRTYTVTVPLGGSVEEVSVKAGDEVEEGQVLIQLDDTTYRLLLEQAQAGVDAADIGLRAIEEKPSADEIERGQAAVSNSEGELDGAIASLDLLESTYSPQNPPDAQLHQAESGVVIAQAGVTLATAQLDQIMAGPLEGERLMAEAKLKEAQAQLGLAELQIEQLSVKSPISGIVEELLVHVGETLLPGTPVVRVLDPTFISVKVYIPEAQVSTMAIGDGVELRADAYPDQVFSGSVLRIADRAQFTPTLVLTEEERVKLVFEVEIFVDGGLGELKPGMPVDVVIKEGSN